jgi:hypothetical protein
MSRPLLRPKDLVQAIDFAHPLRRPLQKIGDANTQFFGGGTHAPAVVPAPFCSFGEPIHPSGIVVEIVGTEMSCQGRSCEEHDNCGEVLKEDVVVRLQKIQLMVEGKEETAITAIWVMGGIDRCHVGFVPRHMVRHAARYDGALAQVTRVFSSDPETCDSTERRLFF